MKSYSHTKSRSAKRTEERYGKSEANGRPAQKVIRQGKADGKPTKYVVVISNVENDFSKVHQACLPSYCSFRPSLSSCTAGATDDACTYEVKCRTETRSAEITVRGRADTPIETLFLPKVTRHAAARKEDKSQKKMHEGSTTSSGDALDESKEAGTEGASSSTGAFASLEDMAAVLRERFYFTHPPKLYVHLRDRTGGELLCTRKGIGKKRSCGDQDDNVTKRHRMDDGDIKEESARERPDRHTENVEMVEVRQYAGRQADLVTAVATLSASWNTKTVRQHMLDIPGFLSCWLLYSKHFRVVFENEKMLFKAKQLLDQFELDGNVRVTLQLSDHLSRRFADYTAAQEALGGCE